MDSENYQKSIEQIDTLSEAQKEEVQGILAGRSSEAEMIAALERRLLAERACPLCQRQGALYPGSGNGLRLFLGAECGKPFIALTGTPLANIHHKGRWFDFDLSPSAGKSMHKSAAQCDVGVTTALLWRHRFLRAIKTDAAPLARILGANEKYLLQSREGSRAWKNAAAGHPRAETPERKPRSCGGKTTQSGLSSELVPVLVAGSRTGAAISVVLPAVDADTIKDVLAPVLGKGAILVTHAAAVYPPRAAKVGIGYETLNQSAGYRVRGEFHFYTVNRRHERLKTCLRRYRVWPPNTLPFTSSGSISPSLASTHHPARTLTPLSEERETRNASYL